MHCPARSALHTGVTVEDMVHAAMAAVTTFGWPTAYAAMTWIDEAVTGSGDSQ